MATIEEFIEAAKSIEGVSVAPLTMEEVYSTYGVDEQPEGEDGNNEIG